MELWEQRDSRAEGVGGHRLQLPELVPQHPRAVLRQQRAEKSGVAQCATVGASLGACGHHRPRLASVGGSVGHVANTMTPQHGGRRGPLPPNSAPETSQPPAPPHKESTMILVGRSATRPITESATGPNLHMVAALGQVSLLAVPRQAFYCESWGRHLQTHLTDPKRNEESECDDIKN